MAGTCRCDMPDERVKPSGKKWCGICGGWLVTRDKPHPRP